MPKRNFPVGKYLFKVSKITLEQRSIERCSNVILLTLNRYLPTGLYLKQKYINPPGQLITFITFMHNKKPNGLNTLVTTEHVSKCDPIDLGCFTLICSLNKNFSGYAYNPSRRLLHSLMCAKVGQTFRILNLVPGRHLSRREDALGTRLPNSVSKLERFFGFW